MQVIVIFGIWSNAKSQWIYFNPKTINDNLPFTLRKLKIDATMAAIKQYNQQVSGPAPKLVSSWRSNDIGYGVDIVMMRITCGIDPVYVPPAALLVICFQMTLILKMFQLFTQGHEASNRFNKIAMLS
ncbi:MAG: hypothetical protein B6D74_15635 [gamma proteobacterium symbiont of Ctena orbiculata]|nr:MAG: hypothetical protein B6D74_15635 [gamma proteobacterium symbiont of Ctena orbiculata]